MRFESKKDLDREVRAIDTFVNSFGGSYEKLGAYVRFVRFLGCRVVRGRGGHKRRQPVEVHGARGGSSPARSPIAAREHNCL